MEKLKEFRVSFKAPNQASYRHQTYYGVNFEEIREEVEDYANCHTRSIIWEVQEEGVVIYRDAQNKPLSCVICGTTVETKSSSRKYCGKCKKRVYREYQRELHPKKCVICSISFKPISYRQLYCSIGCKEKARRRRKRRE